MVFYTHKLQQLAGLAGLGFGFKGDLQDTGNLEENWPSAENRPDPAGYDPGIPRRRVVDLYADCIRINGILPGTRKRW